MIEPACVVPASPRSRNKRQVEEILVRLTQASWIYVDMIVASQNEMSVTFRLPRVLRRGLAGAIEVGSSPKEIANSYMMTGMSFLFISSYEFQIRTLLSGNVTHSLIGYAI
jgi:hypothetical protein